MAQSSRSCGRIRRLRPPFVSALLARVVLQAECHAGALLRTAAFRALLAAPRIRFVGSAPARRSNSRAASHPLHEKRLLHDHRGAVHFVARRQCAADRRDRIAYRDPLGRRGSRRCCRSSSPSHTCCSRPSSAHSPMRCKSATSCSFRTRSRRAAVAMMIAGVHPMIAYGVVGLGAAAYSPAKYGILTELLPRRKADRRRTRGSNRRRSARRSSAPWSAARSISTFAD